MSDRNTNGTFKKGVSGNKAGRPVGSKNVRTIIKELAAKYKLTPIEFMMRVLNDEVMDVKFRMDAAKQLAGYLHGMPTQHQVVEEKKTEITIKRKDK